MTASSATSAISPISGTADLIALRARQTRLSGFRASSAPSLRFEASVFGNSASAGIPTASASFAVKTIVPDAAPGPALRPFARRRPAASAALFAATAKRISAGKCAGGGCLIRADEKSFFFGAACLLWTALSLLKSWAAGSYVFCRADLFREVGGFSKEMFASEELDFSNRLKKLARSRGLRFQIITEQKLVTSARKLHLYGHAAHLRFFLKAMFSPRRTIMNRDKCTLWYDGRR